MPLRTTTTTHEGQELVANSRSFPFGGGRGDSPGEHPTWFLRSP